MRAMPRPNPFALIDTQRDRSVSFAPPDPTATASLPGSAGRRGPVAVGPGRAGFGGSEIVGGATRDGVSGYPIQLGKVQRPPLREETLARHRLLDWLDVKIHNRVVFVTAEAGYGKTTLLADFSRRTRLRTLWYRMDEEDRNWVSFLSYLVAAGRVHDPEFASRTSAMLEDTGPGGASRDDVMDAFLRELPAIATDGAALILDDFHVADDVPDIRHIARLLIDHAPERLTLVFASRRTPPAPVARLRALGELAELLTTDLRFSDAETAALFNETYGRPLEPDVLADLSKRTEGWAASLYLVQAALRDRTGAETRAFIRRLTGAHSEIYDYLAEEVVGDLSEKHQQFLMRTSILQVVDPEPAEVVCQIAHSDAQRLIGDLERVGLLSRGQERRRSGHRYHPLVREFLESRLGRELGDPAIAELNRRVASWAEARDWRTACYHYAAVGDLNDVLRVLNNSISSILGAGEFALAGSYVSTIRALEPTEGSEIINSRIAAVQGDVESALRHALKGVELAPESDNAQGNLLSSYILAGDLLAASRLAGHLAECAATPTLRKIGAATSLLLSVSLDGDLNEALQAFNAIVEESRALNHPHYEGIGLLNSALMRRAQGAAELGWRDATDALSALARSSSGHEVISAQLAQAWAAAHLARLDEARTVLAAASQRTTSASRVEWLIEAAQIELWYGDEAAAEALVLESRDSTLNGSLGPSAVLTEAQLEVRRGDLEAARRCLSQVSADAPTQEPGFESRLRAVGAHVALASGDPGALVKLRGARQFSIRQGAGLWAGYCGVLTSVFGRTSDEGSRRLTHHPPVFLSLAAEAVVDQLHVLDTPSMDAVVAEATQRRERWRATIRRALTGEPGDNRLRAARILDEIGVASDVSLLRSIARSMKSTKSGTSLGKGLARRLAARVMVEDLGRIEIHLGDHNMPGSDLRRKVLAMLALLLTKPKFAATRDEVIDAMWPDLAPEVALNSLNQTVYFLRRVFEPGYKEDLSAGYVNQDSDVLWLDQSLIGSRSKLCRDLLDTMGSDPAPADVDRLSELYRGRFALEFSYEEWAVPHRDALHVGYLRVIESAVNRDTETGHYDRAIRLARRALDIDPEQESLELSLLHLYRITGAHAAAAEQYAHYSAYLRDELGLEPPPLASL